MQQWKKKINMQTIYFSHLPPNQKIQGRGTANKQFLKDGLSHKMQFATIKPTIYSHKMTIFITLFWTKSKACEQRKTKTSSQQPMKSDVT